MKGETWFWLSFIAVYSAVMFIACEAAPARGKKEETQREACLSNVGAIALAVRAYAKDHGGHLPREENLAELHAYAPADVWKCPAGSVYAINAAVLGASMESIDAHTPVVCERISRHLNGTAVGCADGHVQWHWNPSLPPVPIWPRAANGMSK